MGQLWQPSWLGVCVCVCVCGGGGVEKEDEGYLIGLCSLARRPHKLHDGHKHGNDEPAEQNHKNATDVLHAKTWEHTDTKSSHRGDNRTLKMIVCVL